MITYILLWLPMIPIAIVNAVLREAVYGPYMSELRAHQVSTLTALLLFGVYVLLVSARWPFRSTRQSLLIGLIWLVLTVAFEFLFGHYVMGNPWERLLADYNLAAGRLWILVLVWIFFLPYFAYRIRG